MKLHAGSLYKNYLVLYSDTESTKRIIQVDDQDLQWDIYCNDVYFISKSFEIAKITFNGNTYEFEYFESDYPMKDLGFDTREHNMEYLGLNDVQYDKH